MARKANIAREEIHQACWDLLEQNHFPNIPRIADYFLKKDGRHASNTTLLNAITEWEESYKEYQQHQLKELNDALQPAFNHFSREITQTLGTLLDEKQVDFENQQALKESATHQGFLSLSSVLCETQDSLAKVTEEKQQLENAHQALIEKHQMILERYDDIVSHNKVIDSQLKQTQKERDELQLNLSQKAVDLAKLDNKVSGLEEENAQLKEQLHALKNQHQSIQDGHLEKLNKQMEELTQSVARIQIKDRDNK
jgi:chromosome segregation ATPase